MNPAPRDMRSPSLGSKPVIIVGGGLSGLAAAVDLTARHISVLLLEQKPKCGGRAYSFVDETTGDVIDNGQHVLIAGYERTLAFLDRIGTRHLLTIQELPALMFHHPLRGFCELSLPNLPAPFHLLAGILTTNLLSPSNKFSLLRTGLAMRTSAGLHSLTIEEWLENAGQSEETKRSLWEPLAISIMNEHIGKASAQVFLRALRHAFFGRRTNASLAIPHVGLSDLYVHQSVAYIERGGGKVRMNADVTELVLTGNDVSAVRLRDGTTLECTAVILAVPHYRLEAILPQPLQVLPSALAAAPSTAIVSIHLWFEHDVMPHAFVGLIDRRVQWLFNKRKINHEQGKGGHLSCVISGADAFVDMTNQDLVMMAMEDLKTVYRDIPERAIHNVVIREKRATISCTPAVELLRPRHQTGISNLFLAGDWTRTGLPATIEGAVVSGEACAALASARSS